MVSSWRRMMWGIISFYFLQERSWKDREDKLLRAQKELENVITIISCWIRMLMLNFFFESWFCSDLLVGWRTGNRPQKVWRQMPSTNRGTAENNRGKNYVIAGEFVLNNRRTVLYLYNLEQEWRNQNGSWFGQTTRRCHSRAWWTTEEWS